MKLGEIKSAERRALNMLDEWNDCTGLINKHSGYYYEMQACIIDAVHCGIQGALDVNEPLPSACDEATHVL